jgi:hypothetical protein
MPAATKEFDAYVSNIRRIQWVGVAERQLSADVDNRISGEWVHNPYDYSISLASMFHINRLRTVNK